MAVKRKRTTPNSGRRVEFRLPIEDRPEIMSRRIPELRHLGPKYGLRRYQGKWDMPREVYRLFAGSIRHDNFTKQPVKVIRWNNRNNEIQTHYHHYKHDYMLSLTEGYNKMENTNYIVNTPIRRLERRKGKLKFTPTKLKNQINRYFDRCEEQDDLPTIIGLCGFLRITRDTYNKYLSYPDMQPIILEARDIMEQWCANQIWKSQGNPQGKITIMKNLFNWSEKNEAKVEIIPPSEEELIAKIRALAPELLNDSN